jgi:hypothetical protein
MPGSEDMPVLSGLPDDYRQPKPAVDHEIQPIPQLNVGIRGRVVGATNCSLLAD